FLSRRSGGLVLRGHGVVSFFSIKVGGAVGLSVLRIPFSPRFVLPSTNPNQTDPERGNTIQTALRPRQNARPSASSPSVWPSLSRSHSFSPSPSKPACFSSASALGDRKTRCFSFWNFRKNS